MQGTGPDAYTPSVGTPHATWCGLAALTTESETTTVAVKIRLKRMGKIRTAIYRVVVMDSRTKRDGRAIEEIGKYDPTQEPSLIDIDMDRASYWLGQGAQPTDRIARMLEAAGLREKAERSNPKKGEPGKKAKERAEAKAAKTAAAAEEAAE